jgi:hypothetical protein
MRGKTRCTYPILTMGVSLAEAYPLRPLVHPLLYAWSSTPVIGVPAVMRDILLSALTQDFFRNPERAAELKEVEKDMHEMTMSLKLYVGRLNVIQKFDEREWWNRVSITWKIPIKCPCGRRRHFDSSFIIRRAIQQGSRCKMEGGKE